MSHDANLSDWLARGAPWLYPSRPSTLRRLQATARQAARQGNPNWPKGPELRDLVREFEGRAA